MLNSRSIFISVLFLFGLVGQINAITVDNVTSVSNFTTGGARATPVTFSHTITNAQEVLYVGVSNNRTTIQAPVVGGCPVPLTPEGSVKPSPSTPSGLSFGGRTDFERYTTATTPSLNAVVSPNLCTSVEIFRLKNPPIGSNTLSVNIPVGGDYLVIGAISFVGVDSSTPTAGMLAANSGSDRFPSVNVPTPNNGLVLDVIAAEFIAGRTVPSQTLRWNGNFTALNDIGAGSTKAVTGANTTTNWTLDEAGNWALGGIPLKEVASASPASIGGQVLNESNEPINGAFITLQNLQTNEVFQTTTNENGNYYFEGLLIANLYKMTVQSKFYTFSPDERIFRLNESLEGVDFYGSRRIRIQRIIR